MDGWSGRQRKWPDRWGRGRRPVPTSLYQWVVTYLPVTSLASRHDQSKLLHWFLAATCSEWMANVRSSETNRSPALCANIRHSITSFDTAGVWTRASSFKRLLYYMPCSRLWIGLDRCAIWDNEIDHTVVMDSLMIAPGLETEPVLSLRSPCRGNGGRKEPNRVVSVRAVFLAENRTK